MQKGVTPNLITAILPKVNIFNPSLYHCTNQPGQIRPLRRAVNLQRTLRPELRRNLGNDALTLIIGVRILKLDDRIRIGEVLRRNAVPRIENHTRPRAEA